jgi:hypothetical protein
LAQENEEVASQEENQPADEVAEQLSDAVGNVTPSHSGDVPTKGESDALRRLREGKALIVGPSKSPANNAQEQVLFQKRMIELQQAQQKVATQQKELEAKHRQAIANLADTLRNNAGDQAANDAVAEWQRHQAQIEQQRKVLQNELQQLDSMKVHLATEMAGRQRPQEREALPADATTKIYSLRNSQASAMARVLDNVLGGKNLRMAVDERTNSLVVVAEQDTNQVVEALLLRLDQSVTGSAKSSQAGETLQLRIIWLLDDLPNEGKTPGEISMNPQVVEALHDLGFADPRVVCQQVTTLTLNEDGRRGGFTFTVPVLIKSQSWDFEGHGEIEAMADERFSMKFDLGFKRMVPVSIPGGSAFGGAPNRQGAQLGGSIYTPLGHYTVMGTTTFVATDAAPDEEGRQGAQQHLSAFVVYLDRAREFPAKAAEAKK